MPSLVEEATRLNVTFNVSMGKPNELSPVLIKALVLHENVLTIFVSGYGTILRSTIDHEPILDYLATRVLLYDTSNVSSGGNLTMIAQEDINGVYLTSYMVGSILHLVTVSAISIYEAFASPVDRTIFGEMTDEEYVTWLRDLAESTLIPNFVDQLIEELAVHGELPNIARLSIMQTVWEADQGNMSAYPAGLVNSFVQVSSFNVSLSEQQTSDSNRLGISASGVFLPSVTVGRVYFSSDTLIVPVDGFDYNTEVKQFIPHTYLIAVGMDGASSAARAVGQVAGTLWYQGSVDIVDDILRVGTFANTGCQLVVKDGVTISNVAECYTVSYITTLQIPNADSTISTRGTLVQLGQTQLGEKHDTFSSMHFFGDFAYASAAREQGMQHVIDFSNASNTRVMGKLNMSGYSDYIYPLDDGNTLLLAVGRIAMPATARTSILQVAILDVSDVTNPVMLHRHVVSGVDGTSVRLDTYADYQAIRYDQQLERLMLPVEVTSYVDPTKEFSGYYVLVANEAGITQSCIIQHKASVDQVACFNCTYLPSRSMIFNGNLTTMSYEQVKSTNLNSCESLWNFTINVAE
jgi:Beta propeller domain